MIKLESILHDGFVISRPVEAGVYYEPVETSPDPPPPPVP
jgi:hypothetical protein